MTRTEWNELIAKANEHAKELSKIMGKLLDVAENDRIFKKTGPLYAVAEGDLIPKWECRSVTCIWGDTKTLESALDRHLEHCKDEKDTLAGVERVWKPK